MDNEGIYITEGQFKTGVVDGYARIICPIDCEEKYYIGELKMGSYNG